MSESALDPEMVIWQHAYVVPACHYCYGRHTADGIPTVIDCMDDWEIREELGLGEDDEIAAHLKCGICGSEVTLEEGFWTYREFAGDGDAEAPRTRRGKQPGKKQKEYLRKRDRQACRICLRELEHDECTAHKNRQKLENFFADIDGWFKVMDDALKMATCMAECMVLDGEYGKAVIIALLNGYLDKLSGPFEWELEDGKNGIELKMKPKADWLAEVIKNGGIKFTGKAEQIGEDLRKIGEIHDCNARKKIGSALEETSKNLQKAMRVAGPKIVSLLKTASKANVLADGVAGIVEGTCKSSAKCEEECNEKLNKK